MTLDQFWRCPVCSAGIAMGAPGELNPPRCGAHGEMEQTTADGYNADIRRLSEENDTDAT